MTNRRTLARRAFGFTLVEQVTALSILTTAVTLGAGGVQALQQSQRLESAAAGVETDLQYARSLAVARGEFVRVRFHRESSRSCYVIYAGPPAACDCADAAGPRCSSDATLLRHAPFEARQLDVELLSRSTGFGFDGQLGTATPAATIELRNARLQQIRLVVNLMGRVRSCSPGGTVAGLEAC